MKHIATAFTAIRRSPYQAIAATLILSITFFVAYTFSLFLYSSEQILQYFETKPQITAFFRLDTTEDVVQQLALAMKTKTYVSNVTIISKEKALEIYRDDNKEDPLLLELVTADILPASIEVQGKDAGALSKIKTDLQKAAGVDEVVFQEDVIEGLQKWTKSLRYIGLTSVSILGFTSFMIIVIISGMKVAIKKRAIHIMRLLGATKWYVEAPFISEGILYGILGSSLGWGISYVGLLYMTPWLNDFLGPVPLLPFQPELLAIQFGVGTGVAIVLGALASSFAVQRMMRKA